MIDRSNQVWCADITYIPLAKGFVYLVAVMDWFSRRVLAWRLSTGMDTGFCVEAYRKRWIGMVRRRFSTRSRHDAPPFKLLKSHSNLPNISRYWGFGWGRADTWQFQIPAQYSVGRARTDLAGGERPGVDHADDRHLADP